MNKIAPHSAFDIRAEVIISELLANQYLSDIDSLALQPNGGFNKAVRRDIEKIETEENEYGLSIQKYTLVRSGLYEALPIGLFYQSEDDDLETQEDKKDSEIIRRRKADQKARTFFAPFDQLFNRYRLLLEIEERKVLTGFPIGSQHALCEMIYGNFHGVLTNYQKSILVALLPMAHHIVGHVPFMQLAMQAVLGHSIKIEKKYTSIEYTAKSTTKLSDQRLGYNFVLGNKAHDIQVQYHIDVSDIHVNQALDFISGQKGEKTLDILCSYFLPVEASAEYTYFIETVPWRLDDIENDPAGLKNLLGFTIQI